MSVVFFDDEVENELGFTPMFILSRLQKKKRAKKEAIVRSKMNVAKTASTNNKSVSTLKNKIIASSQPTVSRQPFISVPPEVKNIQESQNLQDEKSEKETKIPLVLMAVGGVVAAYLFARGSK